VSAEIVSTTTSARAATSSLNFLAGKLADGRVQRGHDVQDLLLAGKIGEGPILEIRVGQAKGRRDATDDRQAVERPGGLAADGEGLGFELAQGVFRTPLVLFM
jgi:hypothetical protein